MKPRQRGGNADYILQQDIEQKFAVFFVAEKAGTFQSKGAECGKCPQKTDKNYGPVFFVSTPSGAAEYV